MSDAVVELEGVDAGYPERVVLQGVNLQLKRGEITALLGGSGSGKSTLLKTIIGLLPPLTGRVRLLGEELYGLDAEARRTLMQRVGMLFQYGAMFGSRTVFENVALPLVEHTRLPDAVVREMVRMKLELVGLEGLEGRLPSEISGGQRKRAALARAAIMDPEIIFCDEPSAGLDPIVAAGLDLVLRRLQRLFGMSMVVVTHELESIKIVADRVVMLADGAVQAVGTVEELSRSEIPQVRDFFARVGQDAAAQREGSIWDRLQET